VPWAESYEKYQTAMAAGTTPDLGVLWPEFSVQIGSAGYLEPMDDLLDEIGRDNIYQTLIDVHTFGGHTWAAPHVNYCQVLFARVDHLMEVGASYPEKGWPWDEFVEVAKKLTKDTNGDGEVDRWGIGGEIVDNSMGYGTDHAVAMALARHGVHYIDEEGNVLFGGPDTIKAIKELADLYLEHKVMPPGAPGYIHQEYLQLYEAGKLSMLGASSQNYAVMAAEAPEVLLKTIVLPYPTGPAGGANWISPDGIGVFKNSEHKDTAKEFIKFYLQDENIRKWATATRGLCVTKSGNEAPNFQEPVFKVQEMQIAWGWGVRYNGTWTTPVDGELDGQRICAILMQDIVSKGLSVEEAVEKAKKAIEKLPSLKMLSK